MTRALSAATVDAIAEIAVRLHHRETRQPRRSWKQLEAWERPYWRKYGVRFWARVFIAAGWQPPAKAKPR
jgi:hypothetical protein